MKTKNKVLSNVFVAAAMAFGALGATSAQACTVADPCVDTLYVMPGSTGLHMAYGDTLTLTFDGNNTWLESSAEDWEDAKIKLKLVTVKLELAEGDRLVPMWSFKMKNKDPSHVPSDGNHLDLLMHRNPTGKDVFIYNAKHSDGSIHGGSAHMN